jgi:hypothetical protein
MKITIRALGCAEWNVNINTVQKITTSELMV